MTSASASGATWRIRYRSTMLNIRLIIESGRIAGTPL